MPPMQLTASSIRQMLDLGPHHTCGFTRETFVSAMRVPAHDLPSGYGSPRALGGFLYFLVTPDTGVRLHRIRSDQMYHHYLGDPLEVVLLLPDNTGEVRIVGPDLAAGMRPQLLVPGGTFHAGRVRGESGYALLGTSVWLRAELEDVEMGDAAKLAAANPSFAAALARFAQAR